MLKSLNAYLTGTTAKGALAVVMIVGFAVSLPFWMGSTPEDLQYMHESSTVGSITQQVMVADDAVEDDQAELRKMLKTKPDEVNNGQNFRQTVWEMDIRQLISRWVKNDYEAIEIAHWTYHYSWRFHLPPDLVLAVMSVESNFDHFAVSNVGARGLMQVMPFWKKELGSTNDNLFVIETNVRYGCAILRYYLDKYRTRERALQAYNGSLGRPKYSNKVIARMKKFKAIEEL